MNAFGTICSCLTNPRVRPRYYIRKSDIWKVIKDCFVVDMELSAEQPKQPIGFRRTGKFEINDVEFREVSVDRVRILAIGKKWQHFELSIAAIVGMWKEKWRRFGIKLLAIGIILLLFPLYASMLLPLSLFLFDPMLVYNLMFGFMALGLLIVIVWLFVKREALKIYTPSETFRIEGYSGFVDDIWQAIRKEVRWDIQ
jgi:hypothetical protein